MQIDRKWWAVISILAPIAAYFTIFAGVLGPVIPDHDVASDAISQSGAEFAAEFPSRVNLGLITTALVTVSVAAFGFAVCILWHRRGWKIATAAGIAAIIAGLVAFVANDYTSQKITEGGFGSLSTIGEIANDDGKNSVGERMRFLSFRTMVSKIGDAPHATEGQEAVEWLTAISAMVGIAATAALVFVLCDAAIGPDGRQNDPAELRIRWRNFRLVLGFAALVFALSIAVVRGFYRWPLTLLPDEQATLFAPIAASTIQFWGVLFTLVLIFASLPSYLAIQSDVHHAAQDGRPDIKAQKQWREAEGLGIVRRDAFGGLLALATPMLTSPVLDAVSAAFGAVG